MKLTDKEGMSEWALNQCRNGNDTPEMRNLISDNNDIYWYCYYINDTKELWEKITNEYIAYYYCRNVKNRPEVRKFINYRLKDRF